MISDHMLPKPTARLVLSKGTLASQPSTILPQIEHADHAQTSKACQQADTTADTKVHEHWSGEEHASSCEH